MPRAVKVLSSGEPRTRVVDTLILSGEQRRTQRGCVYGGKGTRVEFDFAEPVTLHTDDALLLDDGSIVEVVAEAEPLTEVRADLPTLARIAWTLGDRHVPVQFLGNRLRLRRDSGLDTLIAALGGKAAAIEAPFEPEGGAYAVPHGHGGTSDHGDHAGDFGDHDHRHAHRHGHPHGHGSRDDRDG